MAPAADASTRRRKAINLGMPWYDWDALKVFADAVKQGAGVHRLQRIRPGQHEPSGGQGRRRVPLADRDPDHVP